MNSCDKPSIFSMILLLGIYQNILVNSEEVFFNGTHSMKPNQKRIEVTTVRIAEVFNLKSNSSNTTFVVKEKTAKHFVTSTPSLKVELIPTAKIDAQILRKKKQPQQQQVA